MLEEARRKLLAMGHNAIYEQGPGGVKQVTFSVERYRAQAVIREECIGDLPHILITLERKIAANPTGEESIKYPATWWDAFKIRFFPRWARKRWPSRLTVQNAAWLFPDLNIPQERNSLKLFIHETEEWTPRMR